MRLRIRHWMPALAGLFVVGLADEAAAQCGPTTCPPPPPPCCEPPPPPPPPPPTCCQPPAPPPCCGGGGNVNVNVNVNTNVNASARASARAGSTVVVGGGGGAYFQVDQPYPTTIQGLNVGGLAMSRMVRVPYTETRRSMRRVVIQAVCIDTRSVPHPAAQVRPGRDVLESYEGELYRCLAGTRLQVTLAEYLDEVNFDGGETLQCRAGEALWHSGGMIECRPQRPERDCNERSLLRRYGAGIKILTLYREETYTAWREEVIEESYGEVINSAITLDGGVGGRVF